MDTSGGSRLCKTSSHPCVVERTRNHAIEKPEGRRRHPQLLGEVAWDHHKRLADPRSGTQRLTLRVHGGCIAADAETKRKYPCAVQGSRHTRCQSPSLLLSRLSLDPHMRYSPPRFPQSTCRTKGHGQNTSMVTKR